MELIQEQNQRTRQEARYRSKIADLLAHADVKIVHEPSFSAKPWDMRVHNDALFSRILGQGTLGLGEAYMDGWWDCEQLDELFARVLAAELAGKVATWSDKAFFLLGHLRNRQIGKRLRATAADHYDTGNDLYQHMLDKKMIYTCGYWRHAENLDQAQEHKLELVARKLKLKPGMRVLDVGCGWGGAAKYIADKHGVDVVGITLSEQQYELAQEHVRDSSAIVRLQDFRALNEKFDRVYSLGMFEHVGFKNFADYFRIVDQCLEPGGLFLLHTIGHRVTSFKVDPWMDRYIFPNSILPSAEMINRYSADYFSVEDWHNFGLDYHKTLLAWDRNLHAAWPLLPDYEERFKRMWHYFLMCSAGSFKAYRNHLWQVVFSKGIQPQPYEAVRSAI